MTGDDVHEIEVHALDGVAVDGHVERAERGAHLDVQGALAEGHEVDHHRVRIHERVLAKSRAQVLHDRLHGVLPGLVAEVEHHHVAEAVARAQLLDARLRQVAVGDDEERAVRGAQLRGTHADPLHRGDGAVELAGVADVEHAVGHHRRAAEQVCEGLLRGQRDGRGADAEAGDHRGKVEPEDLERCGDAQEPDDARGHHAAHADDGRAVGDAALGHATFDAHAEDPQPADHEPRRHEDECRARTEHQVLACRCAQDQERLRQPHAEHREEEEDRRQHGDDRLRGGAEHA